MAKTYEVLKMLCPNVEWSLIGDNFDDINWHGQNSPITKKQFQDGFAQFDSAKAAQETAKAAEKIALLARLGITAEEAALLLS